MDKSHIFGVVFACAASMAPTSPYASIMIYNFIGTVTDAGSIANVSAALGDTIIGKFAYDTSTSDSNPGDTTSGVYLHPGITPPLQVTLPNGSIQFDSFTSVFVTEGTSIGIAAGAPDPTVSGNNLDHDITFPLKPASTALATDALPTSIDLNDFDSVTGAFSSFSLANGPAGDPIFYSIDAFIDFEDVVENATVVSIGTSALGTHIEASFTPNFGFSLDEAAQLGGFDHFNWVSYIFRDDLVEGCLINGDNAPCARLLTQDGTLPTTLNPVGGGIQPYLDPPDGGYAYIDSFFPNQDSLPWYWDEVYGRPGVTGVPVIDGFLADGRKITGQNTLTFLDKVNTPTGQVHFSTALAGVYADGTGQLLDNISGTVFKWLYDGDNDTIALRHADLSIPNTGTTTFLGFTDYSSLPLAERRMLEQAGVGLHSGNVVGTAPEPAIIWLFAIALVVFGFVDFRRSEVRRIQPT